MGSIALSIVGAAVSLLDPGLFVLGVVVFALGLITGVVALRRGVRKNLAIVGIILNAANLVFDATLVFLAGAH
jgi:NADH:ubiquinone oxidoreductase subunit K